MLFSFRSWGYRILTVPPPIAIVCPHGVVPRIDVYQFEPDGNPKKLMFTHVPPGTHTVFVNVDVPLKRRAVTVQLRPSEFFTPENFSCPTDGDEYSDPENVVKPPAHAMASAAPAGIADVATAVSDKVAAPISAAARRAKRERICMAISPTLDPVSVRAPRRIYHLREKTDKRYRARRHTAATPDTVGVPGIPPAEPTNGASPNVKMPPSAAPRKYPRLLDDATIPTTGWFKRMAPVDP